MDRVDVRGDGRVILYKRDGLKNPVYQARLRVPNAAGYKIVTTKTANLREAERIALNLYEELYMTVRAGGSIKSRTFKQVFEEWEKAATATATTRQGKSWKPTADRVRTYAIEFFGAKKITEIGESDFADYWVWRKSNFARKAPTNGTLKRERASLLPVFKFAVTKGYITGTPTGSAPSAKAVRRPTFTLNEWRVLSRKMRDWVPNDSFIAFKVPTPLKSILLQMADREGASLSQFLRRRCIDVARGSPWVSSPDMWRQGVFRDCTKDGHPNAVPRFSIRSGTFE